MPGSAGQVAVERPVWEALARHIQHDLRSPLSALVALVELHRAAALPQEELSERVMEYANEGLALIDALSGLLREVDRG